MKQATIDEESGSPIVYVYDYQRKRISTVNILDAIKGAYFKKQEPVLASTYLPYLHYIDDDLYVATPEDKGRFVIREFNSEKEVNISYLPELDFKVPPNDLQIIYSSNATAINREKGIFVSAPTFLGELNFLI